jgi:hypothetical protein
VTKPRASQLQPAGTNGHVLTTVAGEAAWAAPGAGYTDEQVRDVIGAALVAGSNVTITVNDAGDTITIAASAGTTLHASGSFNTAAAGNSILTLGATPYEESLQVFVDGHLKRYGTDYTVSGSVVTFSAVLSAGQVVADHYLTTTSSPSDSVLSTAPLNITDSFNRADSSTSLGTADTGQTWTALAGTWGISSNKAYHVSTFADGYAVIDAGTGDCTVALTLSTVGSGGITFRAVDSTHLWFVDATATGSNLYRCDGFGPNLMANLGTSWANGDIMTIVLSGSSIVVKKNGTSIYSTTDSTYATATKHGLRDYSGAGRYDSLSIT